MGIDINPEDETSYTTKYQKVSLKYLENKYGAKYSQMSIITPDRVLSNNPFPRAMAFRSGQTSVDPYDLSSNDKEYLMPENVVEMTPERSDCAARIFTAGRLYLNSPPESPKDWG